MLRWRELQDSTRGVSKLWPLSTPARANVDLFVRRHCRPEGVQPATCNEEPLAQRDRADWDSHLGAVERSACLRHVRETLGLTEVAGQSAYGNCEATNARRAVDRLAGPIGLDFETYNKVWCDVETRVLAHSPARQYGKSAALGAMYGGSLREFQMQSRYYGGGVPFASSIENGPFTMMKHGGRRRAGKDIWKVVNKHGNRVHRGTHGSCRDKMEKMNFEYAKWLMTKD